VVVVVEALCTTHHGLVSLWRRHRIDVVVVVVVIVVVACSAFNVNITQHQRRRTMTVSAMTTAMLLMVTTLMTAISTLLQGGRGHAACIQQHNARQYNTPPIRIRFIHNFGNASEK